MANRDAFGLLKDAFRQYIIKIVFLLLNFRGSARALVVMPPPALVLDESDLSDISEFKPIATSFPGLFP